MFKKSEGSRNLQSPAHLHLLSPLTARNATSFSHCTMSYDYDFSFYRDDILPNDDLHKSYMGLLRSEVDAGSGSGTSCNFPVTLAGGELEPAHSTVMYNGFSLFQTPPSLPLASSSSSEPSGLWELLLSQLSGSSGAPADNLSQTIPEPEEESASVQPAAATRPGKRKRRLAVSTSSGTHSQAKAMVRSFQTSSWTEVLTDCRAIAL